MSSLTVLSCQIIFSDAQSAIAQNAYVYNINGHSGNICMVRYLEISYSKFENYQTLFDNAKRFGKKLKSLSLVLGLSLYEITSVRNVHNVCITIEHRGDYLVKFTVTGSWRARR